MINSYQIDKKLEPILRQMEKTGVLIDADFLIKLGNSATLELEEIKAKIFELFGKKINLNSPSQLANILYNELKIQPAKSGIKRKKTHHSTSAADLKKIQNLHPSIIYILKYRELSKLKNTYLNTLPEMIDANNKLHTTYKIETATGRLSSSNPNLQNLPAVNDTLGGKIRRAFVATPGNKLLVADYSQIELRIAAHLSEDKNMIDIFRKGDDIHAKTAEELGVSRKTAKVINFGILYGMSAYGVSETLGINVEDAQSLIDKYFLTYPGLTKYTQTVVAEAEKNGYVETLFGRRREILELFSSIERVRNFGQRAAINTPVQGTAADIIKLAMMDISNQLSEISCQKDTKKLRAEGCRLQANLIMQIHDELVFDVPENRFNECAQMVKEKMENAVKLKVPLVVNLYKGNNWGELEKIA